MDPAIARKYMERVHDVVIFQTAFTTPLRPIFGEQPKAVAPRGWKIYSSLDSWKQHPKTVSRTYFTHSKSSDGFVHYVGVFSTDKIVLSGCFGTSTFEQQLYIYQSSVIESDPVHHNF